MERRFSLIRNLFTAKRGECFFSWLFFFLFLLFSIFFCAHHWRDDMKRRTLSGSCGVGIFVIAFVCICIAFATPSWIVSDYRITGAKLDRLGLWTHCFRSLPDVNDDYQRRFFVGCRWVFDPFTTGYDEIRGFLIPRKYFWFSLFSTNFWYAKLMRLEFKLNLSLCCCF